MEDGRKIEMGMTSVESGVTGVESAMTGVESGVNNSVESDTTGVKSDETGIESVQHVECGGQTKVGDTNPTEPVETSGPMAMESSDGLQESTVGGDNSQRVIRSSVGVSADSAPQESAITLPAIMISTNTESHWMPVPLPGSDSIATVSTDNVSHGVPVTPSGGNSTTSVSGGPMASAGAMAEDKSNAVEMSGSEAVDDKLVQDTTKAGGTDALTTDSSSGQEQAISSHHTGAESSHPNSTELSEVQHTQEADKTGRLGDHSVMLSSGGGETEMDIAPSDRPITTVVTTEGGGDAQITEVGTDMQVDVR